MLKKFLKIMIVICFCIVTSNVIYGKNYGKVNEMTITASTVSLGSVNMSYNLKITMNPDLTEKINKFEIPMLSGEFSCNYHSKIIKSVERYEDYIIITTDKAYSAGDNVELAFQINYSKFYQLNKKNEAVYKFKFEKIKGYDVESAKLRWKIENNIYANSTSKDEKYRYWKLGSLGMLSKEIVVKYDATQNNFPESNSRPRSIRDFLLGGGVFFLIFLFVLLTNILPNDGYKRNSGFGFNVRMRGF